MKKSLNFLLSIFVVLVVGISSVRAEDYVSNDFPPENIILKEFGKFGIKIFGKFNSTTTLDVSVCPQTETFKGIVAL